MTQQSWKDHPVSIAAIAVAGTIAMGVLLYKEVILPTHTLSLSNEVSKLINDRDRLKEKLTKSESTLTKIANENKALKIRLANLETSNLFTTNNPYPVGLDQVRIGDPATKITEIYNKNSYPNASIETRKDNAYVVVNNAHSAFKSITYYIDEDDLKKTISHISFSDFPTQDQPGDTLQERLIAALGKPNSNPREDFYSWETSFDTTIFKSNNFGYVLITRGYVLGYWPKDS